MIPLAVLVLSFGSGVLALVYEVLWMRRFTELFGATAPAAAAALSAVFLGMSVGSATLGRLVGRTSRPLSAYGLFELGVGVSSLCVGPLLLAYETRYAALLGSFGARSGALVAVKVLLASVAVFPATILMGATLPYLVSAAHGRAAERRWGAGAVYAANTAGACCGALCVPLLLLPAAGVTGGLRWTAGASGVLGLAAVCLGWRPQPADRPAPVLAEEPRPARPAPGAAALVGIAFCSGAAVMALEVLYCRAFAQITENSTLSFALVVAAFLAALATGAALAGWSARSGRSAGRMTGWSWIVAGGLLLVVPRAFFSLTGGLSFTPAMGAGAAPGTLAAVIGVTLFPPVVLAGMVLPLSMELAGLPPRRRVSLGGLLAASAAGSVLGPIGATFGLLPASGLWYGFVALGVAMLAGGELCLCLLTQRSRAFRRRLVLFGAVAGVLVLVRPGEVPRVRVLADHDEKLVCVLEGSHAIAAVLQNRVSRWMTVDNSYTLGGTSGTGDERQEGHIPLLLHPHPRSVAFLGLGTGITAGAAMLHPVERVVAVELIPEVALLARDHFEEANLQVLSDPRVEVRVDDARAFLRTTPRLDVIVGDLVVPWRPGEASLFTREQFQAARDALAPGGLYCQWLPAFQMSGEHFDTIAATFLDVFPGAQVWRGDFAADLPAIGLVGFSDAGPLDVDAVDRGAQALARKVDRVSPYMKDRAGLWLYLVGPLAAAAPRLAGTLRNTLDRPRLELSFCVGGSSLTGRALTVALDEIQRAPVAGTNLGRLGPFHQRWREAGAALRDASVLALEGHRDEADSRARSILANLPAPLARAVLGDEQSPRD